MKLPPEPASGEFIRASWGRQVIQYLKSITIRPSADLLSTVTANGTTLSLLARIKAIASGGAAEENEPFDVIVSSSTTITVWPGNINQLAPSNIFSTIAYTPGSTAYIKLSVTTDGRKVTAATVGTSATPISPIGVTESLAPTSFEVLLGIVVSGTVYQVWPGGNMVATISNQLTEDKASPVAGQTPYKYWYTWLLDVLD